MALGRVYCFGPTFRAEKSKTRRHLTEFWMVEPEVAYATLEGHHRVGRGFVTAVIARVLDTRARELTTLERDTSKLEAITKPFARVTYDDAVEPEGEGVAIRVGRRLRQPGRDRPVGALRRTRLRHRYPTVIKAFYNPPDGRPDVSLSVDVLAPEGYGGIIGGGQRIDDLETCAQAHRGAPSAEGGLRVVPRPPPLRQRAPRRVRHGHRTDGGLDLRPAPRPRDGPVPADDGAVGAVGDQGKSTITCAVGARGDPLTQYQSQNPADGLLLSVRKAAILLVSF